MLLIILIHISAYLFGSIPFSLIVARISAGIDIRNEGSGNVGATNVLRVVGKKEGAIALLADVLKGALPVGIALFALEDLWAGTTAVIVVLGHVFPIFVGFKGGKGVATSLGALVVIVPYPVIMSIGLWILVLIFFRYVSLASIIAAVALPVTCWWLKMDIAFTVAASINSLIILLKHASNIKRIASGTESKVF